VQKQSSKHTSPSTRVLLLFIV